MEPAIYESLNLDRVILRGGAGELRFGMTPNDVRQLVGLPTTPDPLAICGDPLLAPFDAVDLNLEFKELPGRGECLVELCTENPAARLFDIPFIGRSVAETRDALRNSGVCLRSFQPLKGIGWSGRERLG